MMVRFGLRLGCLVAALAIGYILAPTLALANGSPAYGKIDTVISYSVAVADFALMAPAPVAYHDEASSDYRAAPAAVGGVQSKQRASRSAVRPTAIAGWRSGRTRYLAGA